MASPLQVAGVRTLLQPDMLKRVRELQPWSRARTPASPTLAQLLMFRVSNFAKASESGRSPSACSPRSVMRGQPFSSSVCIARAPVARFLWGTSNTKIHVMDRKGLGICMALWRGVVSSNQTQLTAV